MREQDRIHWDRGATSWSSPVGTVQRDGTSWKAMVYRNLRVGAGFTLSKDGFDTAQKAAAWVENNAEN